MFKVIDDETKKRALDEALKGERMIGEIAEEFGLSQWVLRKNLGEHYEANPDDPRRHLIVRESDKYTRPPSVPPPSGAESAKAGGETGEPDDINDDDDDDGSDADEPPEDDGAARDDMGVKKKKKQFTRTNPNPLRAKVMAALAADKELTQAEAARRFGLSEAAVSYWVRSSIKKADVEKKDEKLRAGVIADIKAGYSGSSLTNRHKAVGKTRIYRWLAEYRSEQEEKAAARRDAAAKARAARMELRKDPEYREQERQKHWRHRDRDAQLQLPAVGPASSPASVAIESTRLSRPSPSEPVSPAGPQSQVMGVGVVRYQAAFAPESQMLSDTLREAIEERNTLRGMVTLLQREAEDYKKAIAAYKRALEEGQR